MLVLFEDRASMSRKSKWIEADSADELATAVARRAIRVRLRTVWDWLQLAASEPDKEVEYVHQLRVSTRRAMVALDMFSGLLPAKRAKWFTKRLKGVRKAAGDARDLDVLIERLKGFCQNDCSGASGSLLQRAEAARQAAQQPIDETYGKLQRRFKRRVRKLLDRIRWRQADSEVQTFAAAAQVGLRPLAATFFSAAEANLDDTQALHEFRIATKQLRYAIEIFAAAFAPSFRKELYPMVEELQESLGQINDHAAGRDRCLTWLDETNDEAERLVLGKAISDETAALQESTRRFREWWTPGRAAELKARFWKEVAPTDIRCA